MITKAVILVGGPSRGTRFRPLSLDIPKPLFPVAGSSILFHQMKALAKIENLKQILLIGFFEESVFTKFLSEVRILFPKLIIKYLREYQALGTAGGIFHFRDEINKDDPLGFFVLHANICSSFDYQEIIDFHMKHCGVCSILATRTTPELAVNYGCIVKDEANDSMLHYVEKPESKISDLISCGVYFFETSVFELIKKAKLDLLSRKEDFGIKEDILRLEQDLFERLSGSRKIYVIETAEPWQQLNTASSAISANEIFLKVMKRNNSNELAENSEQGPEIVGDVYIHPAATVDKTAKIGPNVSIGPGVVIERGVRISNAILLDDVIVKAHSCIIHSIIGWSSIIGVWCRVEGSPVIETNWAKITKNGTKMQSTTIFGKSVTVRDEKIIRNCLVLPNKELKNDFHNEILM